MSKASPVTAFWPPAPVALSPPEAINTYAKYINLCVSTEPGCHRERGLGGGSGWKATDGLIAFTCC